MYGEPSLWSSVSSLALMVGAGIGVGALAKSCFFVVKQKTAAIVETFGKAEAPKGPGLHFKLPWPIQTVAHRVSMAQHEAKPEVRVKTNDNAFVNVPLAVQFKVEDPLAFTYNLDDPVKQMDSYVMQTVRASAAQMSLGELYENKDKIHDDVIEHLEEKMRGFGIKIENVLVDQPMPDKDVQESFNRVIAAKRAKEAAVLEGEAEYTRIVKRAEADRRAAQEAGAGVREQRTEILQGLHDNFKVLAGADISTDQALALIGLSMVTETTREAARGGNAILLPSNPGGSTSQMNEMLATFAASRHLKGVNGNAPAPALTPSGAA